MVDPAQIEDFLKDARDWVSASELAERFGMKERAFRQHGDEPGLLSEFAISSDHGFKHISKASTGEWLRFKHRIRRHGIRELVRIRDLDQRRASAAIISRHEMTFEKDTGQALLVLA